MCVALLVGWRIAVVRLTSVPRSLSSHIRPGEAVRLAVLLVRLVMIHFYTHCIRHAQELKPH